MKIFSMIILQVLNTYQKKFFSSGILFCQKYNKIKTFLTFHKNPIYGLNEIYDLNVDLQL